MTNPLKGNYPILATTWADDGRFDATSQARLIDWLIDSGVHGLVMAANASEGHAQSKAVKIPVMVQDHPVSGVPMNADFLARLAVEIENVSYFKLEFTQSPYKMSRMLAQAGRAVKGMFGGESGVFLIEEYERGGRGAM